MSNLPVSDKTPTVKKTVVHPSSTSAPKKAASTKATIPTKAASASAKPAASSAAKKNTSTASKTIKTTVKNTVSATPSAASATPASAVKSAKPASQTAVKPKKATVSSAGTKISTPKKKHLQPKQLTFQEQMLALWERFLQLVRPLIDRIPKKWHRTIYLTLMDIALIGIGLVIFAYFHHVRQVSYSSDDFITINRPNGSQVAQPTDSGDLLSMWENSPFTALAPTSQPETTPAPNSDVLVPMTTATPSPAPSVDPNDWGAKFADKFTSGNVEWSDTSYRSKNISISIERVSQMDEGDDPQVWFVADIYIRDIENLRTVLAKNTYGKGYKDWAAFMAYDNGGILAISGDYYGAREKGVVIRNGTVYRKDTFKDVCVIYYDGVMETMTAKEFDLNEAIERGAYHAFSFGPALLDANGKVKTKYDSEITDPNPRCAIGYFEPGHYCFVLADGRQPDYSEGLKMHELAQIFEDLGCKAAYNLDGGATASMVFNNNVVNEPYDGGRQVSDIILIGEVAQ